MTERDDRLRWIARHISGVRVSFDGPPRPGTSVEPAEVAGICHELIDLRAERARNWQPRPTLFARLGTWWRNNRP